MNELTIRMIYAIAGFAIGIIAGFIISFSILNNLHNKSIG